MKQIKIKRTLLTPIRRGNKIYLLGEKNGVVVAAQRLPNNYGCSRHAGTTSVGSEHKRMLKKHITPIAMMWVPYHWSDVSGGYADIFYAVRKFSQNDVNIPVVMYRHGQKELSAGMLVRSGKSKRFKSIQCVKV